MCLAIEFFHMTRTALRAISTWAKSKKTGNTVLGEQGWRRGGDLAQW